MILVGPKRGAKIHPTKMGCISQTAFQKQRSGNTDIRRWKTKATMHTTVLKISELMNQRMRRNPFCQE